MIFLVTRLVLFMVSFIVLALHFMPYLEIVSFVHFTRSSRSCSFPAGISISLENLRLDYSPPSIVGLAIVIFNGISPYTFKKDVEHISDRTQP